MDPLFKKIQCTGRSEKCSTEPYAEQENMPNGLPDSLPMSCLYSKTCRSIYPAPRGIPARWNVSAIGVELCVRFPVSFDALALHDWGFWPHLICVSRLTGNGRSALWHPFATMSLACRANSLKTLASHFHFTLWDVTEPDGIAFCMA
jgi:hypothetical protein